MTKRKTVSEADRPVVGYYRVSTAGQVADGISLEAQEAAVRAWFDTHGGSLQAVRPSSAKGGWGRSIASPIRSSTARWR